MAVRVGTFRLLWSLAWRSIGSRRGKSAIVGVLLAFGALLFVVGTALTGSIDRAMERSIVQSLAGDVQVYAADAPDPLALFGGEGMGGEDIGEIPDIARLREALVELPEVEAVIPMGIVDASFATESELDRALGALRAAVRAEDDARAQREVRRVRAALAALEAQLRRTARIRDDDTEVEADLARLARVLNEAFWRDFLERPLEKLEVLDTEVAPVAPAGTYIYLRLLGTDLDRFRASFDRFRLVRGSFVPSGHRGVLLNERFLEQQIEAQGQDDVDALAALTVGNVITLTAFSKSGYPRAVNVRVWGTFTFEGLERSDLAGFTNLTDLVTFRELYGLPTAETRAELTRLKEEAGIREIPRASAEEALFGGAPDEGGLIVDEPLPDERPTSAGPTQPLEVVRRGAERRFDPREVERGLALSAAVLLSPGADAAEAVARIEAVSAREDLGVQAVTWREASGLIGQFVLVIRIVLYVALLVIFAVALVIINNSLIISTLERAGELGTLRALGAQKGFVRAMLLLETLVLALVAGAVGVVLGAVIVGVLHLVGVPAPNDILVFLFGGPALYPTLGVSDVVTALVIIVAVSVLAALYPARVATKVPPVVAMQRTE